MMIIFILKLYLMSDVFYGARDMTCVNKLFRDFEFYVVVRMCFKHIVLRTL